MRNTCVTAAITSATFTKIQAAAKEHSISASSLLDIAVRLLLRLPPEELASTIDAERGKHD